MTEVGGDILQQQKPLTGHAERIRDECGAFLSPPWSPEGGEEPTIRPNARPSNATHLRDLRR